MRAWAIHEAQARHARPEGSTCGVSVYGGGRDAAMPEKIEACKARDAEEHTMDDDGDEGLRARGLDSGRDHLIARASLTRA